MIHSERAARDEEPDMDLDAGRCTAQYSGDFVVFLIGMRINSWWRVREWLPVMRPRLP